MKVLESLLYCGGALTFDAFFIWTYIRSIRDGEIYFQQGRGTRRNDRKYEYWLVYHGSGIFIFLFLQLFAFWRYATGHPL